MTDTILLETDPTDGHDLVVGGVTMLERRLRDLAASGVRRVLIIGAPRPLSYEPAIAVEWVGSAPDDTAGLPRLRANECCGIVVVDAPSQARAEWALCRTLAKAHQGPIDALINWRFSMRLTRRLARARISPNAVTIAAALVGIGAALLVASGAAVAIAAGGILLEAQSILDSCDGELARLTFRTSRAGQWLDNVLDDVVDNLFIVAAGVAAGGVWRPLAASGALARACTVAVAYHEVWRRTGTGDLYAFRFWFERDTASAVDVFNAGSSAQRILRSLARRDTYVFAWMLLCVAQQPRLVAVYGAILGAVQLALGAVHLLKRRPLPSGAA